MYLINENSTDSAGEYPDDVAAVLLSESTGWHKADPDTGAALDEDVTDEQTVSGVNPLDLGGDAGDPKE